MIRIAAIIIAVAAMPSVVVDIAKAMGWLPPSCSMWYFISNAGQGVSTSIGWLLVSALLKAKMEP